MSLEQSQGIQALLAAEKAAAETIKAARVKRQQRLKQAHEEAESEVTNYKTQKEQEFQQKVTQNSGDSEKITASLQAETDQKLKNVEASVTKNKQAAVDLLYNSVINCLPAPHINIECKN